MIDPKEPMTMFYDRENRPLYNVLEWAKLREDPKYQIGQQDLTKKGAYWVSTVWLGIDHSFYFVGGVNPRPVIFETMVFDERSDHQESFPFWAGRTFPPGLDQVRYCTEAEAIVGHKELLDKYNSIEDLGGLWGGTEE